MSTRKVIRRKVKQKPSKAAEFSLDTADVEAIALKNDEPSWLLERRLQAWESYRAIPMPTLKDEAWRRTDIRSIPSSDLKLENYASTQVPAELLLPITDNSDEARVVLHPGQEPKTQNIAELQGQGVIFTDWKKAVKEHAAILETHLGTLVKDDEGKFSALTATFADNGIIIYVPRGVVVDTPLHSILWAPGSDVVVFSRILVILEEGASLTYIHEAASPTIEDGAAVHAGICELIIGEDANLHFIETQHWGNHVWNFTHKAAELARGGHLEWVFGAVGSHLTKNFTELTLAGEGAEARMGAFYFTDNNQHLDHDTQQNHLAPNTTSDLLFKGALRDKSRSVWQGMIYVAPGAQKTDGYQANRNLILSPRARADSIPGLEILADDVRCTHGATIGQLDSEQVYYLMSRGLSELQAESLVVDGFFSPVLERIPFEPLRKRFQGMIDLKMNGGSA